MSEPTNTTHPVKALFAAIDARDAEAFAGFLADNVVFRFGNAETVKGREGVKAAVKGFFDSIAGLRHEIREFWVKGDTFICHGTVTYRRHDGSELIVPFANILKGEGATIGEYLIFADTSALYPPT